MKLPDFPRAHARKLFEFKTFVGAIFLSFFFCALAYAQIAPGSSGRVCRSVSPTHGDNGALSATTSQKKICRQPDGSWVVQAASASPSNSSPTKTYSAQTQPTSTPQTTSDAQSDPELQPINPTTGPSFPCPQPKDPLAQLVCITPQLALLDMKFVQTYEALFQQVGAAGDPIIRKEDFDFDLTVRNKCGIGLSQASDPSPIPPSQAPEGAENCVIPAYQQQTASWEKLLQGPAAEEAKRSIENQVSLQRRLQSQGFLDASAAIDGIFGPSTRAAIIKWQLSLGRIPNGILGDADANLLRSTTSSITSTGTVEVPPNSNSVLDTQKRQFADSAETQVFANPLGIAYANSHETTWLSNTNVDEMSDQSVVTVESIQSNGSGAVADLKAECDEGKVAFTATIADEAGEPNVNIPNSYAGAGSIFGEVRYDDDPAFNVLFFNLQYSNVFAVLILTPKQQAHTIVQPIDAKMMHDALTVWRVLVKISTDHGDLMIRIPVYDPAVEKLIKSCITT